ncbi:MAG TPA: hypothetical protein VF015_06870 [Acidimicrobiales bacterium]
MVGARGADADGSSPDRDGAAGAVTADRVGGADEAGPADHAGFGPDRRASTRDVWIGRALVTVAVLAVLATVLAEGDGVSGLSLQTAWQLLDLRALGDNPVEATWYLHTQPPLHNLLIGLVAWSPLPLAGTLFVLYGLSLLVTGLALLALLVRWGVGPVGAGAVSAVALMHPSLAKTIHLVSYEVPMAMLVVGALWAVQRYLDDPRLRWLLLVSTTLTLGVLTRSLLHPLWLVAVLALVLVARPVPPRHVAAAAAIPLVLVGGWIVKNEVLFDTATTSSWLGFNMQRGVTGPMARGDVEAAVDDGTVSPAALRQPWELPDRYPETTQRCRATHDHATVAATVKNPGQASEIANFNYECYLPAYDQAQRDALALIRRSPRRYLSTRVPSLMMTYRQVDSGWEMKQYWLDAAYEPFLAEVRYTADMRDWNLPILPGRDSYPIEASLTLMAFTLVIVARAGVAAVRLARRGRRARDAWPAAEVVWIVAGWTVVVVLFGSSLVEFGENGRFRAALDPLLIALPVAALFQCLRGTLQHRVEGRLAAAHVDHQRVPHAEHGV